MSLLDALHKGGHLRTLDHALAQSLRRLDRATPDAVLAAAALASLAGLMMLCWPLLLHAEPGQRIEPPYPVRHQRLQHL